MILYLKNGSGIHIKKKNRGKFTAYCGGNVTSSCIAKAKASGNPTLVKRATFAANARKWKHLDGGILYKYLIGGYMLPSNVLKATNNGSAAGGLLEGFGRAMSKILPTWFLKAGTYLSPLNYAAALSKGSVNPKVGEEVISKWHPNILLAARLGEAIFGGKAIKNTPKAVVSTAAKAGSKTARVYLISNELNKGTYTYEPIIPEKRITVEPSNDWTLNLPGKRDYSMSRKPSYSGYTPTKLNPVQSKFVKDVMQGHKWGMNKKTKPTGNKDFTTQLKDKKPLGSGAENVVYEDASNPQQVLKVPHRIAGFSTPAEAIKEGELLIRPLSNLPYNLSLNIEGTTNRNGWYYPVFSLKRVYIPRILQGKVRTFNNSVDGLFTFDKPNVNNILLENDIQRAKDFKLPNIGFLPDGTVMGIDLWKKGGKLCQKIK